MDNPNRDGNREPEENLPEDRSGFASDEQSPNRQPDEPQADQENPIDPNTGRETMSILDLMPGENLSSSAPVSKTDETPEPIVNLKDEYTQTGSLGIDIPDEIKRPSTPPPLYNPELKPFSKEPIEDTDATRVSPDLAYPGATRLELPEQSRPQSSQSPSPRRARPTGDETRRVTGPPPSRTGTGGAQARGRQRQQADLTRPMGEPMRQPSAAQRSSVPSGRPVRDPHRIPRDQVPASSEPDREAFRRSIPKPQSNQPRDGQGCLRRLVVWSFLLFVVGIATVIIGGSVAYFMIARDLPRPQELQSRASTFETARIFDREGNVLYELADPNFGNRTSVPLSEIADVLEQATIATEDARFYSHPGFDPIGITRAIIQAIQEGEVVSGASTITQQLARALLLDEEERSQRTIRRKIREIILAAEITRNYQSDRNQILELYLNEINYGNRAYGIQAAAETYFGKPASDLTLSEAALLAGLPQAPALWDPYTAPDKALGRMSQVLSLMVAEGYITQADGQAAIEEMALRIYDLSPPAFEIDHPHAVFYVLSQLEAANDAQSIYRGGLRIFTTLDPTLQNLAEETITNNRGLINNFGADNAALVSIDPRSGEILAMVGSVDFNDEAISGQVNMAIQPRQPGSTIKPFVYLAAMENGWTPSTLLWDVPTEFPDNPNPPYVPKNFDDQFRGPLLLRQSLGNSYNIPAVKALEFVGVCNFINYTRLNFGFSLSTEGCESFNRSTNYGLSLALGGGEISPLEMVSAYGILAQNGRRNDPFAISRIEDKDGNVLFERESQPSVSTVSAADTFLITNILSDNNARQPSFGINNNLVIPGHSVGAKTGTSGSDRFDVRDGWTIGYSPEIVTGVWVGNTDNMPLAEGASGYQIASPIWNTYMNGALNGRTPAPFERPVDVVDIEVCANSGTVPSPSCTERRPELFNTAHPPLGADQDFIQQVPIDLWTGLRANEFCQEAVYPVTFFNLLINGQPEVELREETAVMEWMRNGGQSWVAANNIPLGGLPAGLENPPTLTCDGTTPRPIVAITQPNAFAEVEQEIELIGSVSGPNAIGFRIEYGISHEPQGWKEIQGFTERQVENGRISGIDYSSLESGAGTIRVILVGPDNPYTSETDRIEAFATVPLIVSEPTPTPTNTPTSTSTATSTSTPTNTPTQTSTPTITPTDQPTDVPTNTPTATTVPPTETSVPTEAPEATAPPEPTATEAAPEATPTNEPDAGSEEEATPES